MMLEYKNVPINYMDVGQGKAVVLLHGFLENSSMWKDLTVHIEKTHRVIAIDLLGHGKTGCLGYIHTMDMMAEAVYFVLEELNVSNAFFVGHSMGGYVALALAEQFPEVVDGLCLMNSTPFADSPERQVNRDRAVNVVKQNHRNFIRMSIANLFNPATRQRFNEEIKAITLEAMKLPVQGIIAALEGMKIRPDRMEVLRHLDAQKLMLLGRQDPVLEFISLYNALNTEAFEIIGLEGGHMAHIENKAELTYNILRFIEK